MNDSLEVVPPSRVPPKYLLTFNTTDSNPTLKAYRTDLPYTVRGNAMLCHNEYWAIFYFEYIFSGYVRYQFQSHQETQYDGASGVLNLGCSSTPDIIFAVVENTDSPGIIQLERWQVGVGGLIGHVVATLPGEYDYNFGGNIFSFNSNATELWISAMNKNSSQGALLVMDTNTGICVHI